MIRSPSWLLVLWAGFAASIASEWIVAGVRAAFTAGSTRPRAAAPRLMAVPRGSVPLAIVSGTVVSAPVYGLIFEWWQRADLTAGLILGTLHGVTAGAIVIAAFVRRRRLDQRLAPVRPLAVFRFRRLLTRVLYGGLIGFLYVVPSA